MDILAWVGPERMDDGKECVAHYQHRHARSRQYTSPQGSAIRAMLEGWAKYADTHRDRFESSIGEDGPLGPEWETIGRAFLALLNGELGGWDGGSLDHNIRERLKAEGFSAE
jgi:hypothetical protein